MKRILALGLCLMLTITTIGCGKEDTAKSVSGTAVAETEQVAESTAAASEAVVKDEEPAASESVVEVKEETFAFTEESVMKLLADTMSDNYVMHVSMTLETNGIVTAMDDFTVIGKSGEDGFVIMNYGTASIAEYMVGGETYASYTISVGDQTETRCGRMTLETDEEDFISSASSDYSAETFAGFKVEPIDETHCRLIYEDDTEDGSVSEYIMTMEDGRVKQLTAEVDGQSVVMVFEAIDRIEVPAELLNSAEELTYDELGMALMMGLLSSMGYGGSDDDWYDDDSYMDEE